MDSWSGRSGRIAGAAGGGAADTIPAGAAANGDADVDVWLEAWVEAWVDADVEAWVGVEVMRGRSQFNMGGSSRGEKLKRVLGVKLAAVVKQRRGVGLVLAMLHFANKNHVVAFNVAAAVKAFKCGRGAAQQRRTRHAIGESNAVPAVNPFAGKPLGQLFLVRRQNINRVVQTS